MLQDMANGRLENEFRNLAATAEDLIVCFHEGKVLLSRDADDALTLPTLGQMAQWQTPGTPQYLFRMEDRNFFLWTDTAPASPDCGFRYEAVRTLRQLKSKEICYAIMTAWHLYIWYRSNRICGCCGTPTVHDDKERMLRCPACGNMIFPRISPAVIVGVTNGDRLLLSKYAGRAYTRYALLAGYTEIGETIEEIFVNIAKPYEYDVAEAETKVFKREIPDVRAAFHTMNFQKYYKVTVSQDQLRQAFLSWQGITDLIAKIVDSLYTAMEKDEYVTMKYMIFFQVFKC